MRRRKSIEWLTGGMIIKEGGANEKVDEKRSDGKTPAPFR